jgi:outer membrane protein insertion porin family
MRLSTVTVCTLAALATLDAAQKATAATSVKQPIPQDVVISTESGTVATVTSGVTSRTTSVSAPETLSAQEFSKPAASFTKPQNAAVPTVHAAPTEPSKPEVSKPSLPNQVVAQHVTIEQPADQSTIEQSSATPNQSAQYYQDFQPISTSPNPASSTLPPAPPSPASPPSQPNWIIPTSTSAAQPVQPAPKPSTLPPSPSSPRSPSSSDLVVTATNVQILGAAPELQQLVRSTIRTQPGGQVNRAQLQADVAAILDTGLFSTASVSSQTNPNGLNVTFQVQPIVVRSIRLVNAQALTPTIATSFFQTQIGATVSPTAINQSIRQVNQWYATNQYNLARVVAVTPSRDGILTLEVAEGVVSDVQVRFISEDGKTTDEKGQPLRGRTQEDFLKRQIQLKPGQVFKDDVAKQDLQRLFQTGLFTTGRVALEGDARQTKVIYVLTEATSRAVNVSGGYNDDLGLFGNFGYSDRNFNGVGQQLGGNLLVGTKDVQFDGRFVSPYRATEPDKLGYTISGFRRRGLSRVFDDDIKLANGDRTREGRFGGGVAVNRPIGEGWNGSLGLNYERISIRDESGNVTRRDARGNPLSFSGTGIDDLTTLNFTATRDTRNNLVDPSSGSILTLSTDQSIPIGRGNILSNRLQANYSEYIPVNIFNLEKTQKQPEVFAFNVQAGTTIGDLPPYNAYTLGGPNSVRGYGTGEVGVSRSFVLASAEYRFPIYRIIGGAVFADFASDLGSSKSVPGQPGVERGRPGTGFGIGVGVRLKSPFGVIRAGYGINDQGDGRFQIGIGEKF